MAAGKYDLLIEQGATLQLNLVYKDANGDPIDITSYTARMQVRRDYNSPTPLLDLTTENGCIILGGAAGTISIEASDDMTRAIPAKVGVYDVELIAPGNGVVTRIIQGAVTVSPEVTKE